MLTACPTQSFLGWAGKIFANVTEEKKFPDQIPGQVEAAAARHKRFLLRTHDENEEEKRKERKGGKEGNVLEHNN